jgi:hypothetical protein
MQDKLPDLPDMMPLRMGLTDSLALWNEMMNSPGRPSRRRSRRHANASRDPQVRDLQFPSPQSLPLAIEAARETRAAFSSRQLIWLSSS